MTHVLHAIAGLMPPWPAVQLFAAAGRATEHALARVRFWRIRSGGVSVSRVSSHWLREHEITSSKHPTDA